MATRILALFIIFSLFLGSAGDSFPESFGDRGTGEIKPAKDLESVPPGFTDIYGSGSAWLDTFSRGKYVVEQSSADQGDAGTDGTLSYLVNHIGSSGGTIYITGDYDYNISTSFTIPENINVDIEKGARLSIDNGVTVTFYSPGNIIAEPDQYIFAGSGIISFKSSTGAVYPCWWGAVGDGVIDDTAAIQAALNACRNLDMRGKVWLISDSVTIPSFRTIDIRGAYIKADCGSDPLFKFISSENLYILGTGGYVHGTAGAFLYAEGSTDKPSSYSHYARQIRLEGITISSKTITNFLDCQKAVRQLMIDKCFAYTVNGIYLNGKCIENFMSDSILFSSTRASGTYGIKTRATGGTRYYCEGLHIDNSLIDAFYDAFDIADIFAMTLNNSWIGASGGSTFKASYPTNTTHTRDISINGCVFYGYGISFTDSNAGYRYYARVNDCTFAGVANNAIYVGANSAAIDISDCKFHSALGTPVGVVLADKAQEIVCSDLDFDETYTLGVNVKGTRGGEIAIRGIAFGGSGRPVNTERPVLLSDIPVMDASTAGLKVIFNSNDIRGAYRVGSTIASVAVDCAKGETGHIVVLFNASNMNSSKQYFRVYLPEGMSIIPEEKEISGRYIYPGVSAGCVSVRIPYYCTKDIKAESLYINNGAGNPVTIGSNSYFGIEKDW